MRDYINYFDSLDYYDGYSLRYRPYRNRYSVIARRKAWQKFLAILQGYLSRTITGDLFTVFCRVSFRWFLPISFKRSRPRIHKWRNIND